LSPLIWFLKEAELNWNSVVRQVHRWLSIAFTAGVLIYVAVMIRGRPPGWVGVFPLLPLISLLGSGLYLFVLPYTLRWRGRRAAGLS
jgi:hypothetical protein